MFSGVKNKTKTPAEKKSEKKLINWANIQVPKYRNRIAASTKTIN